MEFPDGKSPDKHLADYLISKKLDSEPVMVDLEQLERNDLDLDRLRRELIVTEGNLEARRALYVIQSDDIKSQWKQLEDNEKKLQKSFLDFNSFVRENLEKRLRAVEQKDLDKKNRAFRENEIIELTQKFDEMTRDKVILDGKLKSHHIYESYLQQLLGSSSGFKCINDIINKYETYMAAKKQLSEKQEENLCELENARNNMFKLVEASNLIIVGLYNRLSGLTERYEDAILKSRRMDFLICQIKEKCAQKHTDIQLVRESIWYNYNKMCDRKEIISQCPKGNLEQQLIFIKKSLGDLKYIRKLMTRQQKKTKRNKSIKTL